MNLITWIMKRLFGREGAMIKKILPKKKKKETNLPYSSPEGRKKEKAGGRQNYDQRKTQIGIQAGYSPGSQSDDGAQKDMGFCPKCHYPLRTEPSISSPCPNCGYTGSNVKTVFDSGKTVSISSLTQESEELHEFKFRLIKEDDRSEIEIQSPDEPEVILNRSHLDADNNTISSDQHVIMRFKNRKIYIEDVSSNGSSFIQAKNKMMIQDNSRLVMGNKIYVFNQSGISPVPDSPNKTRKFGEFDLNVSSREGEASGFSLTDESNDNRLHFDKTYLVINRSMLDPGNNSISGSRHAEFEYNKGVWYVKDLSSNESTFVQLKSEQPLENNVRILLGNKIFRFEYV